MCVREVIPLRKTDEKMEKKERGKKSRTVETERETFSGARSLRVIGCLSFVFSVSQKVADSYRLPLLTAPV